MITTVPRLLTVFSVQWQNIGDPDMSMDVRWTEPDGSAGFKPFLVGSDVFLETPTLMAQVPDDQLLASVSMGAILGGGVLPGTKEFDELMGMNQVTKDFQTIIGNARIKSVARVPDNQLLPGQTPGTVYDLEFFKVGSATNTKTIRSDVWTISLYANRANSYALGVNAVPGFLHKEFGFKASQVSGLVTGEANRLLVEAAVLGKAFWL